MSMNQALFETLINKGECRTVDYKETHYFTKSGDNLSEKKDKDAEFVKDIISFVNTVRDESAYILIGVKGVNGRGVPIGINEYDRVDNAVLQQKVRGKANPAPHFICYPFIDKEGRQYDIIEIPIVWYPNPCVTINYSRSTFLIDNKVYLRSDSGNAEADQSEIRKINAWLDGIPQGATPRKVEVIQELKDVFFDEETIQKLFGNEAAEDENLSRLKEYYFKNDTFDKITVNVPIRILVGHKGIGKSALFKIAKAEDSEQGKLSLTIRPDEVSNLGKGVEDFLDKIRSWKQGLLDLLIKKIFIELGIKNKPNVSYDEINCQFIEWVSEFVSNSIDEGNIRSTKIGVADKFLKSLLVNIYIDDLDRGWIGGKADINRISALLNAIRDITQDNKGLQFKVSLRSDVYYLVRTSDESTDKIQSSVIWYQWTQHEILVLLIKRVLTFYNRNIDEGFLLSAKQSEISKFLKDIIELNFSGFGKWSNVPMHKVLLSVIRKRPRDLVKLLTLAARNANKRKSAIIHTKDLQAIFDEYSQDRIQDTVNEYRSELPEIEKLIFGMKPDRRTAKTSESYYFTRPELMAKLEKIKNNTRFYFSSNPSVTVEAKALAQFLYKINFITATKKLADGYIDRKDFEENRYLSSDFVDFGYDWEIHMAFRWGLQPNSQEDLFNNL